MIPVALEVGPWPMEDNAGMQVGIELLQALQKKGKNDVTYVQFDSIQKSRSAYYYYASVFYSSPSFFACCQECSVMKGEKG